MEAIWCFRSSRFAAAAVLAAAAAASSEGALQDLKLRLKWKWEITTPHARGINGIIGPEGVLMPPEGHRAQPSGPIIPMIPWAWGVVISYFQALISLRHLESGFITGIKPGNAADSPVSQIDYAI